VFDWADGEGALGGDEGRGLRKWNEVECASVDGDRYVHMCVYIDLSTATELCIAWKNNI